MTESGSTKEQLENFILNSQKVPKLLDEEPVWSIQSKGIMSLSIVTSATKQITKRTNKPRSASQRNINWPPANWRTAPKFISSRVNDSKMQGIVKPTDQNVPTTVEVENQEASTSLNHEGDGGTNMVDLVDVKDGLVDQDASLGHGGTNTVGMVNVDGLVDQDGSSGFSQKDRLSHGPVNREQASLTGRRGEELAFNCYKNMGIKVVKWVNEASETGLPYDIEVCEDNDQKEYIEVKTTDSDKKDWFEISVREWQFAVKQGESFSIARVVLLGDKTARVTVFKNPPRLCQLKLGVLMAADKQG